MKIPRLVPVAICLAMLSTKSADAQSSEIDISTRPTITVSGHGEASTAPNVAYVNLGVETQAPSAVDALDANNKAMRQLIDTLERQDIPGKNVQTNTFDISPQYRHDDPERRSTGPQVIGYRVSNQVRVKTTKLDGLGDLLDSVVRIGANRIHGIQFDVEEADSVTDQARKEAMKDARRKAELLAQAAGARVGRPLQIHEAFGGGPEPPRPMMMAMARESVPIAQGEQNLAADITVTYELLAGDASDEE